MTDLKKRKLIHDSLTIQKRTARPKVAVLMLTVDAPSNGKLWKKWSENHKDRCNFYVNAKNEFREYSFMRRIDFPVRNTNWGDHTLVDAHQALLRDALKHDSENQWFCLVSGDSIPVASFSSLLTRFSQIGPYDSFLGQFLHAEESITHIGNQIQTFFETGDKEKLENWWLDKFSRIETDEEGEYATFDSENVTSHSQFIMLSRKHAQILSNMPSSVASDLDKLLHDIQHVKPLAPDELVPFAYLSWKLGQEEDTEDKGKLINNDIMYAPTDPSGRHAKLHKKPIGTEKVGALVNRWYFARKFEPLNEKQRQKIEKLWAHRF